jgi:chaperonin GroES
MNLKYKGRLDTLIKSQNICDLLPPEDISAIGQNCRTGYVDDKASRAGWETWYAEAMKLALQVKEDKSFPWPNCSNIKFPLLTIAALNFHAKAYPAIVNGESVVKCRVVRKDPDGSVQQRADRVGKHMSYQLLECMPWEEQTDKQLLVTAIMGTTFKKTVRDNNRKVNCSDLVMPQDLVVNYYTTDLESCPRASHRFTLTKNERIENINSGLYRKPDTNLPEQQAIGPMEAAKDKAQKLSPPADAPVHFLIEQSCFLDLDGDGYEEPYAVTFDENTGFVYRILARFYKSDIKKNASGAVVRIEAENYYTKFGLIPSPDGGFYDMGLGSCSVLSRSRSPRSSTRSPTGRR